MLGFDELPIEHFSLPLKVPTTFYFKRPGTLVIFRPHSAPLPFLCELRIVIIFKRGPIRQGSPCIFYQNSGFSDFNFESDEDEDVRIDTMASSNLGKHAKDIEAKNVYKVCTEEATCKSETHRSGEAFYEYLSRWRCFESFFILALSRHYEIRQDSSYYVTVRCGFMSLAWKIK